MSRNRLAIHIHYDNFDVKIEIEPPQQYMRFVASFAEAQIETSYRATKIRRLTSPPSRGRGSKHPLYKV